MKKKLYQCIMLCCCLCFLSISDLFAQQDQALVRLIDLNSNDISWLKQHGYQPQFDELPNQAVLSLPDGEISILINQGLSYELIRESMNPTVDDAYHDYTEIWNFIDSISAIYPDIMMVDTLGYSQLESLPLPLVKISDNPYEEEDEIVVLYDGMHHAREPIGAEICMKLIIHLLENYGSDPAVDFWVDETEIFILPMINPEGWKYITDEGLVYPFWRKNKHDNDSSGSFSPLIDGVDLNRNYLSAWDLGDPDMSSEVYRGPAPFSETETTAKKQLVLEQKPVMAITYHSFGEVVIYSQSLGGTYFPDYMHIAQVGASIASNINKVSGAPYNYGFFGLEAGLSNFWMYAEAGCFEYCIETGTDFIPPFDLADQVSDANLSGALYLLDRVRGPGISGHVNDSTTGEPLIATYEVIGHDNATISPRRTEAYYGRYFRPLLPGTYSLKFQCLGYYPKTIENVVVTDGDYIELDVKLLKIGTGADIDMIDPKLAFDLFPNPAKDIVYLQANGYKGSLNIAVFDANGTIVLNEAFHAEVGTKLPMSIADLNAGIYLVRISTGTHQYAKRMIKY